MVEVAVDDYGLLLAQSILLLQNNARDLDSSETLLLFRIRAVHVRGVSEWGQ